MNARVAKAVDVLLDLHEDVNSRMQKLLLTFPAYSEQAIRLMAQADPTAEKAGNYITWICKMYKEGKWARGSSKATPAAKEGRLDIYISDDYITELRLTLADFDARKDRPVFAKKNEKYFPRPNMCRDILNYKSPEEVEAAIKRSIVIELTPEELAEAKAGTKVICGGVLKEQGMLLFKIMNFQAARLSAKGTGDFVPPDINHGLLLEHAGSGDPGWPWAGWCTSVLKLFEHYPPPLYVVKKGENPYIQVWFGNGTGGQAMDIHDNSIKSDQAAEIAPLFNSPEFEQFASETINMHVLFAEIASKTDTQIGYNLKGGRPLFDRVTREPIKDPVTDKQKVSAADCKTNQECFDKMLSNSEKWRTWGLNLAENINTPIDLPDPRHPSYRLNKARIDLIIRIKVSRAGDSGVGALLRAIQPHLPNKGFIMPNELSDPVLFKQRYAQMLLDRNWRHEFGEIPFAPDAPAPDQI